MERINQTLKRLASNADFMKRYEQMKEEIMLDLNVQDFLNKNRAVVDEGMIERSLIKLYEFTNQSK